MRQPLSEMYGQAIAFIDADLSDASQSVGSGFILGTHHIGGDDDWSLLPLLLVTNRHVVPLGARSIDVILNHHGAIQKTVITPSAWLRSDADDLAIAVLAVVDAGSCKYVHVPIDALLDASDLGRHYIGGTVTSNAFPASCDNVGLGSEVFMLGRFSEFDRDTIRIRPVARFGQVSMLPVDIEVQGEMQNGFLVEMRSIAGFSGSPTFVWDGQGTMGGYGSPAKSALYANPKILGVECANVEPAIRTNDGSSMSKFINNLELRANAGLTVVIPAWRLRSFIESNAAQTLIAQAVDDEKANRHKWAAKSS